MARSSSSPFDPLARRVPGKGWIQSFVSGLLLRAPAAQLIEASIDPEAVEPRAERGAALVAGQLAIGGQEDLLDHVFGVGSILQHAQRKPRRGPGSAVGRASRRPRHPRHGRARPGPGPPATIGAGPPDSLPRAGPRDFIHPRDRRSRFQDRQTSSFVSCARTLGACRLGQ